MRSSQTWPDPMVLVLLGCSLTRRNVSQSVCPLGARVCAAQCRLLLFKSTSPHRQKKKFQTKPANFQNPQKWSKTVLMESSGLPMGPEGHTGVCLEATGPAQWLVVYNLQRNWFPSGKVVISGKTPLSHAFRTARCSSGTSRLTGQPDSSAGGMMGEGSGSAARPVLC